MNPLHLLIGLSTITHIAATGTRFTVTLAALKLGASPFTVGLMMATFALLPMLLSVKAGRLADRIGERWPMLISSVISICAILLPLFWDGLPVLFATCLLVGGASNIIYMSTQPLVGRHGTPEDRPANFGLFAMGFSTSSFAGPVLAGFAIEYINFNATFLFLATLPVALLVVLSLDRLPLARQRPNKTAMPAHEGTSGEPQRRQNVFDLLRDVQMRKLYLIGILFSTAWDVFIVFAPIYASGVGLSASQIGIVTGTFSIATFSIRGLIGILTRYFTPWQLLIMSLSTIALCYLGFGLAASFPVLVMFSFMLGIGHGLSAPMTNTLLYEAAPPDRIAEAVGLRMTASNTIQTSLPLIAGSAGAALGIGPVFWATAVLMIYGSYLVRSQWHAGRGKRDARKPEQ